MDAKTPRDASPWDPMPSVQVSNRTVVSVHAAWLTFGFLACFARNGGWLKYAMVLLVSFTSVQYFLDRVRRRPATASALVDIDEKTPTWIRITMDICNIVIIVIAVPLLIFD